MTRHISGQCRHAQETKQKPSSSNAQSARIHGGNIDNPHYLNFYKIFLLVFEMGKKRICNRKAIIERNLESFFYMDIRTDSIGPYFFVCTHHKHRGPMGYELVEERGCEERGCSDLWVYRPDNR